MDEKRPIDAIWDAIRDPFYEPPSDPLVLESEEPPWDPEEPPPFYEYIHLWLVLAPDDPYWLGLGGDADVD